LCTVFIFVSCEEKGCYRIVSLGHQNFDCRSYCGLSRRMQGSSCGCLSLEYREIILGLLTGEMDLLNYNLILGKAYLICGLAGAKKRNHLSDTLKELY